MIRSAVFHFRAIGICRRMNRGLRWGLGAGAVVEGPTVTPGSWGRRQSSAEPREGPSTGGLEPGAARTGGRTQEHLGPVRPSRRPGRGPEATAASSRRKMSGGAPGSGQMCAAGGDTPAGRELGSAGREGTRGQQAARARCPLRGPAQGAFGDSYGVTSLCRSAPSPSVSPRGKWPAWAVVGSPAREGLHQPCWLRSRAGSGVSPAVLSSTNLSFQQRSNGLGQRRAENKTDLRGRLRCSSLCFPSYLLSLQETPAFCSW